MRQARKSVLPKDEILALKRELSTARKRIDQLENTNTDLNAKLSQLRGAKAPMTRVIKANTTAMTPRPRPPSAQRSSSTSLPAVVSPTATDGSDRQSGGLIVNDQIVAELRMRVHELESEVLLARTSGEMQGMLGRLERNRETNEAVMAMSLELEKKDVENKRLKLALRKAKKHFQVVETAWAKREIDYGLSFKKRDASFRAVIQALAKRIVEGSRSVVSSSVKIKITGNGAEAMAAGGSFSSETQGQGTAGLNDIINGALQQLQLSSEQALVPRLDMPRGD